MTSDAPLRVIQWATGGVGRAAIEGVLDHPELELVGCWVHSRPTRTGATSASWSAGSRSASPRPTTSTRSLALDADCVVYARCSPTRRVVDRAPAVGQERRDAARLVLPGAGDGARPRRGVRARAASTLHGTGIHPGGITERFPLDGLGAVGARSRTCGPRSSPTSAPTARPTSIRDLMLFGATPEEARTSIMADALGAGFRQSVRMVADELGFAARPGAAHDPRGGGGHRADRLADRRRSSPGLVAAQRFRLGGARRRRAGRHRRGELADGRGAPRPAVDASGPRASASRSRSPATRRVHLTFKGLHPTRSTAGLERNPGIVATAMHCVNAVPYVVRAPSPGIRPTSTCRWSPAARPRAAGPTR